MFKTSFFFTEECFPEEIFVNQKVIEDFVCNIGKGVYDVPVMTNCDHIFCQKCLEN